MITIVAGENYYEKQSYVNGLINNFVQKYGVLSVEKLDASEVTEQKILDALMHLPFLASSKLVVLTNPQSGFLEGLSSVSLADSVEMIIIVEKIDKRSKYYKVISKLPGYKYFSELDAFKLSNWLVGYVKNAGGKITKYDANYLINKVGVGQITLASEVDKLLAYSQELNKQSVDLLCEPSKESRAFELIEASFRGDLARVDKLFKDECALGLDVSKFIGLIVWQLHLLSLIKTSESRSSSEIAKESKISPYAVQKSMTLASKISIKNLKKLISQILEIDIKIKTKNYNAKNLLLNYLYSISGN